MSDAVPDDTPAASRVMRRSQIRYGCGLPDVAAPKRSLPRALVALPCARAGLGVIMMLLEAPSRFRDLLFGDTLRSFPGFDCRLAILGDRLPDHPAGNGVRWKGDLQRRNQHDREDHLP